MDEQLRFMVHNPTYLDLFYGLYDSIPLTEAERNQYFGVISNFIPDIPDDEMFHFSIIQMNNIVQFCHQFPEATDLLLQAGADLHRKIVTYGEMSGLNLAEEFHV